MILCRIVNLEEAGNIACKIRKLVKPIVTPVRQQE